MEATKERGMARFRPSVAEKGGDPLRWLAAAVVLQAVSDVRALRLSGAVPQYLQSWKRQVSRARRDEELQATVAWLSDPDNCCLAILDINPEVVAEVVASDRSLERVSIDKWRKE